MPPFHTFRTRTSTAAVVAALALTVAGCGGSDSSSPAAPKPSSSSEAPSAAPKPVATTLRVGEVAGIVQPHNRKVFLQHRKRSLVRVGNAVDEWLDGAFVGVHYPRRSFPHAFASFSHDAKRDALKQQRLLTNRELSRKIDGVVVKRRAVSVDFLAPQGHPVGATARVHLRFKTTGHRKKTVSVTGRLFLTRDSHGAWQVFGYDVAKGAK